MTILLTNQLKKDLVLIDDYYSQKQLSKALEISINKMMKMRDAAGLIKKDKGRPKGTGMTFKGEENTRPKEVIAAKDRAKIEIKIQTNGEITPLKAFREALKNLDNDIDDCIRQLNDEMNMSMKNSGMY